MLLLYLFDYADTGIFGDWSLHLHKNSRQEELTQKLF